MYQTIETAFYGFDHAILSFWHTAAEWGGGVLTPLFRAITFVGEKGLLMFALALVLVCFPRTRKLGVCIFGAVCCGALITNVILKDFIARPRPFHANPDYAAWWQFVGAPAEEGFSFPSGHVTAATAGMTAWFFCGNKKIAWAGSIYVLAMACSRNYLVAHYPSDVLAALVIGVLSAAIAWGITHVIYCILDTHTDNKLVRFILHFDLRHPSVWKN